MKGKMEGKLAPTLPAIHISGYTTVVTQTRCPTHVKALKAPLSSATTVGLTNTMKTRCNCACGKVSTFCIKRASAATC